MGFYANIYRKIIIFNGKFMFNYLTLTALVYVLISFLFQTDVNSQLIKGENYATRFLSNMKILRDLMAVLYREELNPDKVAEKLIFELNSIISGILFLGEVIFTGDDFSSDVKLAKDVDDETPFIEKPLETCSELFGLYAEDMINSLTKIHHRVGK